MGFIKDVRIAAAIAGISIIGFITGVIDETMMATFLTFAGFQGLAGVRELIDSTGSKTYILAGLGAAMTAFLFLAGQFDFIDPVNLEVVMKAIVGIGFTGAAGTLAHAKKKVG